MKPIFALIVLFTTSFNIAVACDVCGCSGGGHSQGILPGFKKHFVAFRVSERGFDSRHIPLISRPEQEGQTSKEYFTTFDLWGRIYLHKRLQLFTFIPYVYNVQNDSEFGTDIVKGLGDVSTMLSYVVFNTGDSLTHKLKHSLTLGGGIKLPTGKFGIKGENSEILIPSMQPGSGTVDFLFSAAYNIRIRSFGINYDVNYRINTENKKQYRYGNKTNSTIRFLYWKTLDKVVLIPNTGFSMEHSAQDWNKGRYRTYSGGYVLSANLGVDTYIKNIGISVLFTQPFSYNIAKGFVDPVQRWTLNFSYLF